MTKIWATAALKALQQEQTVQVRPQGHSMTGRISDGDLVTLAPRQAEALAVGNIVLVRIQGKRFSHIVLHSILAIEEGRFLIGSHQGRIDGWVRADDIYGIATAVLSPLEDEEWTEEEMRLEIEQAFKGRTVR